MPDILPQTALPVLPGSMAGTNGLIQVASNRQIDEHAQATADAAKATTNASAISAIAAHIDGCFELAKREKSLIERRILDSRRREQGEYDQTTLAAIREYGGSETFIQTTGTKCTAALAWITDLLFSSQDRAWALHPTEIPDLPEYATQRIVQAVMAQAQAAMQSGQSLAPEQAFQMATELREQIVRQTRAEAEKRAERMQSRIDDQFEEGGFWKALAEVVMDMIATPAGILKGPVVRNRRSLAWKLDENKRTVQDVKSKASVEFECVDPLDFYPAPNAKDCQTAAFIIERMQLNRSSISLMRGADGYKDEEITKALEEYGRSGYRTVVSTDSARATNENKPANYGLGHGSDTIECLEFWGSVQGSMLKEWGMTVEDETAEYEISALKIGTHVVKCILNENPLHRRPYYTVSFKPCKGSIWGKGIPEIIADGQDIQNGTVRNLQNNLAISSGPQVGVNVSALQPGFNWRKLFPWKVWPLANNGGSTTLPITFFQPQSNAAELIGVFSKFSDIIDDVSGVPRYTYGNDQVQGAGQTASGLSMLLNSAGKRIKLVLYFLDTNVLEQAIRYLYEYNMLYDEDESIKGDVNIVPQGAMALVVREYGQQARLNLLSATNNPVDVQIVDLRSRARLWREVAKAMNIDEAVIPDEKEIEARIQAMVAAQQAQQMPPGGPGQAPGAQQLPPTEPQPEAPPLQ